MVDREQSSPPENSIPAISLLLPVYNQQEILGAVVDELISTLDGWSSSYEIWLGENGSTDDSLAVCERIAASRARVYATRATAKGYGNGILAAMKLARGRVLAYLPSDGQVEPSELPRLFDLVLNGRADLAKGIRTSRENLTRTIVSRVYNLLANVLFGVGTRDTNGPPKVFSRAIASTLELESPDSFIDVELLWKARHLRLRVIEAPVTNRDRAGGKSSTSWRTVREFLRNMWRHRVGPPADSWRRWSALHPRPAAQ